MCCNAGGDFCFSEYTDIHPESLLTLKCQRYLAKVCSKKKVFKNIYMYELFFHNISVLKTAEANWWNKRAQSIINLVSLGKKNPSFKCTLYLEYFCCFILPPDSPFSLGSEAVISLWPFQSQIKKYIYIYLAEQSSWWSTADSIGYFYFLILTGEYKLILSTTKTVWWLWRENK